MRFAAFLFAIALTLPTAAEDYHVVLVGSGGADEYREQFRGWGTRLRDTLVMTLDVPASHLRFLAEAQTEHAPAGTTINLEAIRGLFEGLRAMVTPDDTVFVYLIGHGSYLKDESKFHIPGPDLTASLLDAMLAELEAGQIVVIDSTASSAGFINVLSGPGRIVGAATKSVTELNATHFMNFFIEGLEDGSADRNHDERISVLEACEQAAELTSSWYTTESLIATEHAILDDNGDGLGSRLPVGLYFDEASDEELAFDGPAADRVFIKNYHFPEAAPRELIATYLGTLDEIEALKARKKDLDESVYYAELERLFLVAARANRDIRSYAKTPASDS